MVLIRKQSAVVIKNMQDMHCQRCFVGPMWVVGAILLLTTIVFTATNAEHIQSNGAHAIRNASQVSAIFHLFQNYSSVCFFFHFSYSFCLPSKIHFWYFNITHYLSFLWLLHVQFTQKPNKWLLHVHFCIVHLSYAIKWILLIFSWNKNIFNNITLNIA